MIVDCWNTIGIHGDSSCPELKKYVHCRNCPVYSNAALDLLDVDLPAGYRSQWAGHIAQTRLESEQDTASVIVFRVGVNYLALPTVVFKEIADVRAIHTIPQRHGPVLGLANVRGELIVCISLARMLGLEKSRERLQQGNGAIYQRLLVLECDRNRTGCPVDEVYGVHRFDPRGLSSIPAVVAKSTPAYTKAVLPWREKSVALLDERLLSSTFDRSLASTAI